MDGSIVTRIYICPKHGTFEIKSSIKDEPLRRCKTCNEELKRVFSKPTVLFCQVNKNRFEPINPQPEYEPML